MYVRSPASERFRTVSRQGREESGSSSKENEYDEEMGRSNEKDDEAQTKERGTGHKRTFSQLEPVQMPEQMKHRIDAIGKDFEIGDKIKLWMAVFLSLFDKITDLFVLIGFAESKEWKFFTVLLLFHIVSGIAISIYMLEHYPWRSQTAKTAEERERKVLYHVSMKYLGCFLALFQLGPTFAALRTLFTRDAYKRVKEQDFRGMKLIDTVFQSLPELCLQVYIGILKNRLVVGRASYDPTLTVSIVAGFISVMGCYFMMEREPAFGSLFCSIKSSLTHCTGKRKTNNEKGLPPLPPPETVRPSAAKKLPVPMETCKEPLNTSPLSNEYFDWDENGPFTDVTRDTPVDAVLTASSNRSSQKQGRLHTSDAKNTLTSEQSIETVQPTPVGQAAMQSGDRGVESPPYCMAPSEKHYFMELLSYSVTRFFEVASRVLWLAGVGVSAGVGVLVAFAAFHFFAIIFLLWATSTPEIWAKISKTTEKTFLGRKWQVLQWNDTKMLVFNMAWPPGLWVSDATDANGKFWWRDKRSGRRSFSDITGGLLGTMYYNALAFLEFIVCFIVMGTDHEQYLAIYKTWAVWATLIWIVCMLVLRELFIHRPFGAGAMGTPPHVKEIHRVSRGMEGTLAKTDEPATENPKNNAQISSELPGRLERRLFLSPESEEATQVRTPFAQVNSNAACPLPPTSQGGSSFRRTRRSSFGGLPRQHMGQAPTVQGSPLGSGNNRDPIRRHSSPPRVAKPIVASAYSPGVVQASGLSSDSSERPQQELEGPLFGGAQEKTPVSIHSRLRKFESERFHHSSEDDSGSLEHAPASIAEKHGKIHSTMTRKFPLPTLGSEPGQSHAFSLQSNISNSIDMGMEEDSDEENFWRMRQEPT
uniref:XK-related protein n=1 Tax=Picocystis salinarum TaxID=88271 RepID=A0A7S3U8K7_9CHLO|mmetsp:Transcript_782/g.4866  ORF Transcript_782/g.4866 Transcript_782/m.4866 type:complete len:872 (+) Transcript_782:208-2823(+)